MIAVLVIQNEQEARNEIECIKVITTACSSRVNLYVIVLN